MQVLVLGGCGIQGRAALYDLSRNSSVEQVTCADIQPDLIHSFEFLRTAKIQSVMLDVNDPNALASIMNNKFDVVLDFLPPQYIRTVAETAIDSGVHLVNTNYAYDILDLDTQAKEKGIAIAPECGLDPGIDLIIYQHGLTRFDEMERINSYCGGIPEKTACDNPINYKVSWNLDAVLKSQNRDATLIKDRQSIHIPAADQHDNEFIHQIEFPGLGRLEAIPNGDAAYFCGLLGIRDKIIETGRYSLRWPGWCDFWRPMKQLGFLDDIPLKGLPCELTPSEFLTKLLAPRLQYKKQEKDLVVMLNEFEGLKDGQRILMTCSLSIERDLQTGLMAMSVGVAYPACIVAEMIVNKKIEKRGVLSPVKDIPLHLFMTELKTRGIKVTDSFERIER
jgi:saccharopine dehydrogenase-like NADP-dependent oxidoreductase